MNKLRICIVGVGLIGGSFGLSIKKYLKDECIVVGNNTSIEEINKAIKKGAIDIGYVEIEKAVKDADIIYFATHVMEIFPLVQKCLPHLKKGAIITDAGSTKYNLANKIWSILPEDIYFVPAHPMTGREKSGVMAASSDLFYDKAYIFIKDNRVNKKAQRVVMDLVTKIGSKIYELTLEEHDRCASIISHIPHIMAATMVNLLWENPKDINSCLKLAGGGFKDTTRIASSNEIMWRDICLDNKEEIINHIEQIKNLLTKMEDFIKQEDKLSVTNFFKEAKNRRNQILEDTQKEYDLI